MKYSQRNRTFSTILSIVMVLALGAGCKEIKATKPTSTALKIAYSDWPGWIAFEIGIQKGWFKEAGVDTEFEWFDYAASMKSFTEGNLDAVMMTMGDALITGAPGARSVCTLVTDYSNGNDMIVAKPGIGSLKELKGKKVGLELGLVEHLLLVKGLEKNGLNEKDVTLIGIPTHDTVRALELGMVDAIGAWQPNSGQVLKSVPSSKAIFTSADMPGLIYDLVCVSPKSLAARRDDWVKVIKVWNRIVKYVMDPATKGEAVKIMAGRAGVSADEYAKFLPGTRFLTPEEALARFERKDTLESVYGSGKVADTFNVEHKVYEQPQPIDNYIDGSLSKEALTK
jgi:NitT/TauT family transport system substrate-binding protein